MKYALTLKLFLIFACATMLGKIEKTRPLAFLRIFYNGTKAANCTKRILTFFYSYRGQEGNEYANVQKTLTEEYTGRVDTDELTRPTIWCFLDKFQFHKAWFYKSLWSTNDGLKNNSNYYMRPGKALEHGRLAAFLFLSKQTRMRPWNKMSSNLRKLSSPFCKISCQLDFYFEECIWQKLSSHKIIQWWEEHVQEASKMNWKRWRNSSKRSN